MLDTTSAPSVSTVHGRAHWSRLAALGFAMAAAGPLLLITTAALFGLDVSDAAFVAVPIVALGAASVLVWRAGTWAKIVGIVLGLLGAMMMFWLLFGLFVPSSFFDFMSGVLFVPGVLLGVVGSGAAIVAGKRGHYTPAAEGGEARGLRITVVGLAALAVLSGVLTVTGRTTADPTAADASITMSDFEFSSKDITIAGGSTLFVENDDPFLHTFTIEALDVDVDFSVGTSKLVEIPNRPGTYVFFCRPHSSTDPDLESDDMAGRITIT